MEAVTYILARVIGWSAVIAILWIIAEYVYKKIKR